MLVNYRAVFTAHTVLETLRRLTTLTWQVETLAYIKHSLGKYIQMRGRLRKLTVMEVLLPLLCDIAVGQHNSLPLCFRQRRQNFKDPVPRRAS